MPRRRVAAKRAINPDPKFGSVQLARFINVLMKNGKKSVAESIVYNALEEAFDKLNKQGNIQVKDHFLREDEQDAGQGSHFWRPHRHWC